MKRLALAVCLTALALPVAARTRNISMSSDDDSPITSCDQIRVSFDSGRGYRAQESLPVAGVRSLKVTGANNGGIYVLGGNSYSATLCKFGETESDLSAIRGNLRGNEATAEGPDDGNWVAIFLVTVPRGASLDVDTTNGPISLRDVSGTVNARAVNGPLSLRDSSGTLDVETQNGPISVKGGSGTVKATAHNGPVSVRLEGSTWNGSLDARTINGPLSVRFPAGFASGTVIESDGHGPMSCHAEVCRSARRSAFDDDDDRPRRIEFGSGPTVVHLSTVNGPVSVKED